MVTIFPPLLNPWQFWQHQPMGPAEHLILGHPEQSQTNVGFCLQSVGDSDVNYDRQLVLAFFGEYYNRQSRAQVLICRSPSTAGRNARMFWEYLNYVVHFLPIAQETKHKRLQRNKNKIVGDDQCSSLTPRQYLGISVKSQNESELTPGGLPTSLKRFSCQRSLLLIALIWNYLRYIRTSFQELSVES